MSNKALAKITITAWIISLPFNAAPLFGSSVEFKALQGIGGVLTSIGGLTAIKPILSAAYDRHD